MSFEDQSFLSVASEIIYVRVSANLQLLVRKKTDTTCIASIILLPNTSKIIQSRKSTVGLGLVSRLRRLYNQFALPKTLRATLLGGSVLQYHNQVKGKVRMQPLVHTLFVSLDAAFGPRIICFIRWLIFSYMSFHCGKQGLS